MLKTKIVLRALLFSIKDERNGKYVKTGWEGVDEMVKNHATISVLLLYGLFTVR